MDIAKNIETELVSVIESLCHGAICPIDTLLRYRQQKEIYDRLTKSVVFGDALELALLKFKKTEYKVITISYKRKYDFSDCDDGVLQELEVKQADADAAVKARHEFLQKLPQSVFCLDGTEIKPPTYKINRIISVANAAAKKQAKYV